MRPQPRTQSVDLCSCATLTTPLFTEEASLVDPGELFVSFSEAKTDTDFTSGFESASGKEESSEFLSGRGSIERFCSVCDTIGPADVSECAQTQAVHEASDGGSSTMGPSRTDSTGQDHQRLLSERVDQASMGSAAVSAGGGGREPCEDEGGAGSPGASRSSKGAPDDVSGTPADTFSKAEQLDKKKGDLVFDLLSLLTETRLPHGTLCCR